MKLILLFFVMIYFSVPAFSQPEFKIALDHIEWSNPAGNNVTLEINLKITNVSNTPGACEDLVGIWLYSSDEFYNYDIRIKDYSKKIFQIINPGDFIYSYITFEVPKAAGGLFLKFSKEYGGAEKFITDSYNEYVYSQAENYFQEKNYQKAIQEYLASIVNDPNQKNKFEFRIADCYELLGDNFMEDYYTYNVSDNLKKSIEDYKLCLSYNPKRSSVKDKIAKSYDMLGDIQTKTSDFSGAIISYNTSLLYNNSKVVNSKIESINAQLLEKKKMENEKKKTRQKMEEYKSLISPTTGFSTTAGIGYHSNNNNNSKYAPFGNLQLNIPVKVYTQKKMDSPLNVFLNFELGYSGFIGNENDLAGYLNIDKSTYTLEKNSQGPILNEYYINAGVGISILKVNFIPMLSVNYGVFGQSTFFDLFYTSSSIKIQSNKLSKIHIGQGLTLELSFKLGKSFLLGYSFKNYKINSSLSFLDNKYSAHCIIIGFTSF